VGRTWAGGNVGTVAVVESRYINGCRIWAAKFPKKLHSQSKGGGHVTASPFIPPIPSDNNAIHNGVGNMKQGTMRFAVGSVNFDRTMTMWDTNRSPISGDRALRRWACNRQLRPRHAAGNAFSDRGSGHRNLALYYHTAYEFH